MFSFSVVMYELFHRNMLLYSVAMAGRWVGGWVARSWGMHAAVLGGHDRQVGGWVAASWGLPCTHQPGSRVQTFIPCNL